MTSLVRDFTSVFSSNFLLLFIGLASNSFLAWHLAPEGLGAYYVCLVFGSLITVFFTLGCDVACIYFVASKKHTLSKGVIYAVIFTILTSLVALPVGYFLAGLPIRFFDQASARAFELALINIPIAFLSLVLISLLTAIKDFNAYAILSVLFAIIQLFMQVLFVRFLSMGVEGLLLAINISGMLSIFGTLMFLRIRYNIRYIKPNITDLGNILNYGVRYYFGKVSNILNSRVGTSVLAFISDTREVGLFALAAQLTEKIEVLPNTLSTVLIPRVAQDNTGHVETVAMCARLTMLICSIVLLLLAIFSHLLVKYAFSSNFLPSVILIQILCIGAVFRCTSKVFVPYLLGTNQPGIASYSVACGMLINVVVVWFGYSHIGLASAALGMVLGYLASSVILLNGFMKTSKLGVKEIFRFRESDWIPLKLMYDKKIRNR